MAREICAAAATSTRSAEHKMLFNSFHFLIFLPIVLSLYFLLPQKARQLMLVAASFFFYMYWNVRYSLILVFFIVLDYSAGLLIEHARTPRAKKLALSLSLTCNLGVLAVFKYYGFFVQTLRDLRLLEVSPSLGLLLPLGISFHTFQTMSYTIDVYRGVIKAERSLLRFAVFVSYFPQLVAGPIERAREILPQLRERHGAKWDNFVNGGRRILCGYVKKVVLADNIAAFVNQAYGAPETHAGAALLVATWLFAWQIYFDFSGYSDMAIGFARVMGIRFSENFNFPYIATSIQEFWRRWHISLSSWLRDYLYISLGGNRRGRFRTYANLVATMLLGGLWHGASWNFVIWGALHGVWQSLEKMWRHQSGGPEVATQDGWWHPRRVLWCVLTFNGVCVTWVFFRAKTLSQAVTILRRIALWEPGATFFSDFLWFKFLLVACLGAGVLAVLLRANPPQWKRQWAAAICGLALIVLAGATSDEFIYFVF